MAKLTDQHRRFIVQELACFRTPSQVAASLKEEHKVEAPRQQVEKYDPTKRAGANLSKHWREVFRATRQRYLEEIPAVPVANQRYRLEQLQRAIEDAQKMGNVVLAAQLLEQAAKEVGGAYTNRREHSGPGGGPIRMLSLSHLSDEQLERLARGEPPEAVIGR